MFHLTPIKNIDSIYKRGLLPTYVYLNHAREYFINTWKINKAIFLTPEQTNYSLDKLFKDFVYWQELKKPITIELQKSDKEIFDYDKPLKLKIEKENKYVILKTDIETTNYSFYHAQCTGQLKCYGDCIEEFGHDKKLVYITPNKINKFEIYGYVDFNINRFNKPIIKIKWNKRR